MAATTWDPETWMTTQELAAYLGASMNQIHDGRFDFIEHRRSGPARRDPTLWLRDDAAAFRADAAQRAASRPVDAGFMGGGHQSEAPAYTRRVHPDWRP